MRGLTPHFPDTCRTPEVGLALLRVSDHSAERRSGDCRQQETRPRVEAASPSLETMALAGDG